MNPMLRRMDCYYGQFLKRYRLSNFRNLSTVRDKVVDRPFLFNRLHKVYFLSMRGWTEEICNLCAKESSYRENRSISKIRQTRALLRKRKTEKEKDTVPRNGLKFWKKVSRQKNVSANVSLGTIPYSYVKRTTREGIEAPDLCHVRTSLVAEGLKLLPDLIARVTTCARM